MTPVPNGTGTANGSNGAAAHDAAVQGFSTRALHIGSEPSLETGAVIPAISLATTFLQDGVGGLRGGYEYSRSGNPNRNGFERALAALETPTTGRYVGKPVHGIAFSSGSAATATIMTSLPPNSHVVSVNDVYGGTHRYFTKVAAAAQHVETTFVDMDAEQGLEERIRSVIRPTTKLLWIETPTNPTLRLIDIARISELARGIAPEIRTVVDNTFLSPWYQLPLELGADIVVHSLSKYINGHSDVIMGAAITPDPVYAEKLRFLQNAIGAIPSPFDCWLALRGLKTLAVRMKQHGENALHVARFLEAHPLVETVIYPGLPSHPAQAIAAKQIAAQARKAGAKILAADPELAASGGFPYGGMLSFRFKGNPDDDTASEVFLRTLQVFTLAESLGGVESLVELPSKMTHGGEPIVLLSFLHVGC